MATSDRDTTAKSSVADTSEKRDGRHERVERGKVAVFEALTALFSEGRYNPPVAEVAARAGVSERTLFRYFGSYNDVIAGTVGYVYPRVAHYFAAEPPVGTLHERLFALVALRTDFSQRHGVVTRTTEALAHEWPAAAAARYGRVALLNDQLKKWLGDDLKRVSDEKLVVLSSMLDIPSLEGITAALGDATCETVARAAVAIIEAA